MVVEDIFKGLDYVDLILVRNGGENTIDKAFFYLSNTDGGSFEQSSLILTRDGRKLFVYALEEENVKNTGIEAVIARTSSEMTENIKKAMGGVKRIGVNMNSLNVRMFNSLQQMLPDVELVDVSKNLEVARVIKSSEEIAKIDRAAKIGSKAFSEVIGRIREGMTESEASAELIYSMMKNGATGVAGSPIVCFGPNSSIPHHFPGERKLAKGDFVLMDYCAQYKRYCSDITRTVVFGKPTEQQSEMYDLVYEAQLSSMNMIRHGANGKDINKKAYDVIDSTKYKGKLMHGIGHGIGLEVHDHPALGSVDYILKTNMAITDEPGVYLPGYGGVRIEDDLLVTDTGYRRMSESPPAELISI